MPRSRDEVMAMHAQGNKQHVGDTGVIKLPEPAPDQHAYLERIRKSGEDYDKTAVVGGPPRKTD
jgi:hypothetical protein